MHYITAVRMSDGGSTAHITSVRWLNAASGLSRVSPVGSMVEWIDKGNEVFVGGDPARAPVQVVRPSGRSPYLRSKADSSDTDNLLLLPRY